MKTKKFPPKLQIQINSTPLNQPVISSCLSASPVYKIPNHIKWKREFILKTPRSINRTPKTPFLPIPVP